MQPGRRERETPRPSRGRPAHHPRRLPSPAPCAGARGGERNARRGDGTGARAGGHGTDGRAGRRAGGAGKRHDARARPGGGVVTGEREDGRRTGDGRGERRGERRGGQGRRAADGVEGTGVSCGGENPAVAPRPPGPSFTPRLLPRPTDRATHSPHSLARSLSRSLSRAPPTPHTASSTQPRDAPAATSDGRRAPRSTHPQTPTAGSGAGTERGAAAARGKARGGRRRRGVPRVAAGARIPGARPRTHDSASARAARPDTARRGGGGGHGPRTRGSGRRGGGGPDVRRRDAAAAGGGRRTTAERTRPRHAATAGPGREGAGPSPPTDTPGVRPKTACGARALPEGDRPRRPTARDLVASSLSLLFPLAGSGPPPPWPQHEAGGGAPRLHLGGQRAPAALRGNPQPRHPGKARARERAHTHATHARTPPGGD
ncbi:uncharacterized protein AAG666_009254 [Megaptera novaeangliae]